MNKSNFKEMEKKDQKSKEHYALNYFMDGFFYFFGFIDNPAKDKVDSILNTSASEQIKADLQRINQDFRKHYTQIRKEVLCLE
jgi:hypothetical protein